MSHISYSVRRNPGGDPVATESRRRTGWLQTSLAAALLALPMLPVMAADAPGVSVSPIHSFTESDGANPHASLVQGPDGSLYGTTEADNNGGYGTVFSVHTDGTGFQTLHQFNGADGELPNCKLLLLNGVLYGTTETDDNSGTGTVFSVHTDGTGFQTLYQFNGFDGVDPYGGLINVGGVLYGTTRSSYLDDGTIFSIHPDGTNFQTVHYFDYSSPGDGYHPSGELLLFNGALYGTTEYSYNGDGTVFKINPDSSGFQTLHQFTGGDGGDPFSGLTAVSGVLYGTTEVSDNGNGSGTVFEINPDGTGFQTLHDFTSNDQAYPFGELVQGQDGNLYGTTLRGDGDGTVFSFNPNGTGFQTVHDFNYSDGYLIFSGLILGTDGNFYGTAYYGGDYGAGSVYRLMLGPATTASLSGPQGSNGWYTGDVTVTLTASDPVAAITNTYYSIDGGAQQIYTVPFVVSGDLAHTVVFHSEDAHGTVEADETQAVDIDGTAPTLTFGPQDQPANAAGWNNGLVTIPYMASDDTSGVDTPGTSGVVPFFMEGANQTQLLIVTDVAGNQYGLVTPAVNIDLTAPVTTATVAGSTAQDGDYTGTATVTLTPTDNLSGVDATYYSIDGGGDQPYTVPFTVSGDGPHTVTYYSVDVAGNIENTETLNLTADATAPTTTASLSGPQGAHGWYTGDVTVTLTPTDAGSGVASAVYSLDGGAQQIYTVPFTVSGDGRHRVTFHSVDVDGNVEQDEFQSVRIDGTAPTLTFDAPSPAANANGWNNGDVTYSYTATDATSGFAEPGPSDRRHPNAPLPRTLTGSTTVTGEGTGLTQTVSVTDIAGNSTALSTPPVNIDRTKPVTLAATQSGPAGQTVTLTATDNLSGVASTVYSIDGGAEQPYTVPFTVSGNGDHVVAFHSVDGAGNVEDANQINFTVNIAAPVTTASLSGTQGDNGWYTSDVTVTLAAQAAGVAVGSTFYTVDGGTQQTYTGPFVVSGDAVHTVTYWSVDAAGNAEAQNRLPVKIDGTAPVLTVGAPNPAPNAAGWNNSAVTVSVSGTDATSGLASLTPGNQVTFSGAGKDQTKTISGKDNAGNTASASTPKVNIDLTAPTTTASPSGSANSDGSYTTSATVTLSAGDDLSGVASTSYSVDGGTAKPYTDPFTVSGTGTHTVTFSSTDVAGNAESPKTLTVTVAAPPTPVLHTFGAGLQMIAVTESYGSASTALNPAPSKLAVWSPSLVQYTLLGGSAPLAPGQGYWVRLGASADLLDNGTPTPTGQPFTISLQKGWNMIGDPFPGAVSLSGVSVRSTASGKSYSVKDANLAGLISATLYSYPAGSNAYQPTGADGSLAPYTGYWIYAFGACSLSLPAAQ